MFFILIYQKFLIVGATIFMPVKDDYKSRENGDYNRTVPHTNYVALRKVSSTLSLSSLICKMWEMSLTT